MKALEKDRNRRYESASALAADVQRYLADEPVQACPPSASYRMRKFIRRHRAAVPVLTAIGLGVLFAAGSLGWVLSDQRARQAALSEQVIRALDESSASQKLDEWPEARASWHRAVGLLATDKVGRELERAVARRGIDLAMADKVQEIALQGSQVTKTTFDDSQAAPDYTKAFLDYGIDVQKLEPEAAAARIRQSSIPRELTAALDHWAFLSPAAYRGDESVRQRLLATALAADPDPWRSRFREAAARHDREGLVTLAASQEALSWAPQTRYLLGRALSQFGAVEESAAFLRKAHDAHPKDFWIAHHAGVTHAALTPPRLIEALRFYTVARSLRPQSPGVHHNLGDTLHKLERLDEAVLSYREAIRLNPEFALAYTGLGLTYEIQGRSEDAIAAHREAIRIKGDFAEAFGNLGNALAGKGLVDEAIEVLREAVRLAPKHAGMRTNLGVFLLRKGAIDEAIAAHREAIRMAPRQTLFHYNLANALHRKGLPDEAIPEYQLAIKLDPSDAAPHNRLGSIFQGRRRFDEAIAYFREALRLEPENAVYHNDLGVVLLDKGKDHFEEALVEFRHAARLDPKKGEYQNNIGTILQLQGRLDDALPALQKAIALTPDNAVNHENLGWVLQQKGLFADAANAYREAVRLNPKRVRAHYNLGNALRTLERLDEAIAAYRDAASADPNFAEAHWNLGQALHRKGEFVEALASLKRGHELGSRDPLWKYPSARWLADCERWAKLDARLPEVLGGAPASAAERGEFAQICGLRRLHGAATRLWHEAFTARPDLADNLKAGFRYRAARDAALSAAGQGKDAGPLDETARAGHRNLAQTWLRAELDAHLKAAQTSPLSLPVLQKTVRVWQVEADLASVRDETALSRLPADEQLRWRAFWADVALFLRK